MNIDRRTTHIVVDHAHEHDEIDRVSLHYTQRDRDGNDIVGATRDVPFADLAPHFTGTAEPGALVAACARYVHAALAHDGVDGVTVERGRDAAARRRAAMAQHEQERRAQAQVMTP